MFLCCYCGSTDLEVKDKSSNVSYKPNKEAVHFSEDTFAILDMLKPYIICNSCRQIQDNNFLGVWQNRLGMSMVVIEEI